MTKNYYIFKTEQKLTADDENNRNKYVHVYAMYVHEKQPTIHKAHQYKI
jgi:hypothetical protein